MLLKRLQERDLIKVRERQRTDSTHVLADVRGLNRLERVGETLRAALNELAVMAPDWLQVLAPAAWYERYSRRVENYRLPKTDTARVEHAAITGADGRQLLAAIDADKEQPWLAQLPAGAGPASGLGRSIHRGGRTVALAVPKRKCQHPRSKCLRPTIRPLDTVKSENRHSKKRDIAWVGYKVHLTETCDPEMPRIITNVGTTPASTPDDNMVAPVHQSLEQRALLPSEHLLDKGYTDSHVLVDSQQQYDVTIVGPVADDPSWQARAGDGSTKSQSWSTGIDRRSPARLASRASLGCRTPGLKTA